MDDCSAPAGPEKTPLVEVKMSVMLRNPGGCCVAGDSFAVLETATGFSLEAEPALRAAASQMAGRVCR